MDGERALLDRKRLVFVVDECPFEVPTSSGHVNRFSILVPLMTVEGERVFPDPGAFPNRGRVWWLIRDTIPTHQVVPGSVWSGQLEQAARWDRAREDNDKFQAKIHDIQLGGGDLIELIPVPDDEPDVSVVQRPRSIPFPRPVTSRVILAGRKWALGPLIPQWDPGSKRLSFSACSNLFGGSPEALRIPIAELRRLARVEDFETKLAGLEEDVGGAVVPHRTSLTRLAWLNIEKLRAVPGAETVDISTDLQVMNWAARLLQTPRSHVQPLRELLQQLVAMEDVPPGSPAEGRKLKRLEEIARDANRVLDMGEEVARDLAHGAFEGLVTKHIQSLTRERVDAEVRRRREEIEAQVEEKRRELARARADFEQALAQHRRQLQEEREESLRAVAEEKRALRAESDSIDKLRLQAVAEQDQVRQLLGRFEERAERLGEDLIVQVPVLRKLGFAAHEANGSATSHEHPSAILPAPAAPKLQPRTARPRSRTADELIREEDFLDHFAEVVECRGYVFPREDLINFHVSMKAGGLTILAGLSGTGKSSLPLLYSEALGTEDSYLHVPVRPDWLDDRDLVGAFNALARRFEPAPCGIVEHLIAAAEDAETDEGGLYLICLDEMNLARVEHYFAQFLSVLELPVDRRHLTLFAPGLASADDPYMPHRTVKLGENLRFLGTVNIDETTHFFSPKVLDRSQVVAFSAPDLSAPRRGGAGALPPRTIPAVSWRQFRQWLRSGGEGTARDFVLGLNEVLKRSRSAMGFRQFDRILDYVACAQPFLSEDQALDYQIAQIILPRLRPTAPQYRETLQGLRGLIARERFPRAAECLMRIGEQRAEDDFFQLL